MRAAQRERQDPGEVPDWEALPRRAVLLGCQALSGAPGRVPISAAPCVCLAALVHTRSLSGPTKLLVTY